MRQILSSIGFGLLLFAIWVGIIVLTSSDFAHEGPDTMWFAPIEWWASVLRWSGIARFLVSMGPVVDLAGIVFLVAAPFIALFSVISFFALRFLSVRRAEKSLA